MIIDGIDKKCIEPNCPRTFHLPQKERKFYEDKGLPEPRRCKPCRESRRQLRGGRYHPLGGDKQKGLKE